LFFGTADSIGITPDNVLHIHDLKTGKTPASMHQLEIYAAYFMLEYDLIPSDFTGIELRIYQSDEVKVSNPEADVIIPIMDKIVTVNKIITTMEDERWMS
jgi:RecB family exonuclease